MGILHLVIFLGISLYWKAIESIIPCWKKVICLCNRRPLKTSEWFKIDLKWPSASIRLNWNQSGIIQCEIIQCRIIRCGIIQCAIIQNDLHIVPTLMEDGLMTEHVLLFLSLRVCICTVLVERGQAEALSTRLVILNLVPRGWYRHLKGMTKSSLS